MKLTRTYLTALFITFLFAGCAGPNEIQISLEDEAPFHVHEEGKTFTVRAQASAPKAAAETLVSYFWKDFTGTELTPPRPMPIDSSVIDITSPSDRAGYYGLVFETNSPTYPLSDRKLGEKREYGFVILPRTPQSTAASPFGVVHADITDPYLPPWVKTTTWFTQPPSSWKELIQEVRDHKKQELSLIIGDTWLSHDTRPVSKKHLDRLQKRTAAYFKADRSLAYWEAGLEENLNDFYKEKYYWENLKKKFARLHKTAKEAHANIKFIYQIVGADAQGVTEFFENKGYHNIDIISLHPYAWPDFISPDVWLEDLLQETAKLQKKHGTNLPVWFTEIGAPHLGNSPDGFFGYPEENKKTGGLSPQAAASFMTKLCVIARSQNVGKIFWYNYQDRSPSREEAEAHFGMRDFWGYPKPVYAAYFQIQRLLGTRSGKRIKGLPQGVKGFSFKDKEGKIVVIWGEREIKKPILFSLKKLSKIRPSHITDAVGHPVAVKAGTVALNDLPIFLRFGF